MKTRDGAEREFVKNGVIFARKMLAPDNDAEHEKPNLNKAFEIGYKTGWSDSQSTLTGGQSEVTCSSALFSVKLADVIKSFDCMLQLFEYVAWELLASSFNVHPRETESSGPNCSREYFKSFLFFQNDRQILSIRCGSLAHKEELSKEAISASANIDVLYCPDLSENEILFELNDIQILNELTSFDSILSQVAANLDGVIYNKPSQSE